MAKPTVLELELPEATLRKLKALAMLTGMPVGELESKLVGLIDTVLTEEIAEALGLQVSGTAVADDAPQPIYAQSAPQVVSEPAHEEEIDPGMVESEHGLSSEDDDGKDASPVIDDPSIRVPAKRASVQEVDSINEDELRAQFKHDFPNAGNNADAFLDAAMEEPGAVHTGGVRDANFFHGGEQGRKATKAFHQPRVTISEHTEG